MSLGIIEIEEVGCGIGVLKGAALVRQTERRLGSKVSLTEVDAVMPTGQILPVQKRLETPGGDLVWQAAYQRRPNRGGRPQFV